MFSGGSKGNIEKKRVKWLIVPLINHCTRKKYYTTNKLTPAAVGDRKVTPRNYWKIFFEKTLNKKLNEIYKEMDQQTNHKDHKDKTILCPYR